MPTLFKRSNGIYYVLQKENGRVRWLSTGQDQRSSALEVLMNIDQTKLKANESRQQNEDESSQLMFSKFIQEFLSYVETNFSPKTKEIYALTLKKAIKYILGMNNGPVSRWAQRYRSTVM